MLDGRVERLHAKILLCIGCAVVCSMALAAETAVNGRESGCRAAGIHLKWGTSDFDVLHLLACFVGTLFLSVITYKLKCSNDAKNSFRRGLLPYMQEIASGMDGVLAQSNVYLLKCKELADKGKCGDAPETKGALQRCLDRIKQHCLALRTARKSVRYFVWDKDDVADQGLRKFEKVGGWITQFRDRPAAGLDVLKKLDELRKSIDKLLINTYDRGVQPSWWCVSDVERRTRLVGVAFEGNEQEGSIVVAGVDFIIPNEILKKYQDMVNGNSDGIMNDRQRLVVYEKMLNALSEHANRANG